MTPTTNRETDTMTYTIIEPGKGYELHRAGCADLKKPGKRTDILETFEAANVDAFLDEYFDEEMVDLGYSPDDCKVFPCCK